MYTFHNFTQYAAEVFLLHSSHILSCFASVLPVLSARVGGQFALLFDEIYMWQPWKKNMQLPSHVSAYLATSRALATVQNSTWSVDSFQNINTVCYYKYTDLDSNRKKKKYPHGHTVVYLRCWNLRFLSNETLQGAWFSWLWVTCSH